MNRRMLAKILAALAIAGVLVMSAVTFSSWWAERHTKARRLASVGGGPTALCPFGWYQPDPNTSQCSTAFGWQPSIADAATNVFTIQGLTPNDDDFVVVLVKVQAPGATDETGRAWFRYRWGLTYRADGSAFADPTGATTPTAVDSQIGSGLTGTTVTLLQSGSNLQVTTNCASTASCASTGSVDWFRNAPAPWVTGVSPSMAFASPTSPLLLTITTTPGGTNGLAGGGCIVAGGYVGSSIVTACPSGSLPLTGCTQQSQTTATCFLPAGSYTSGVDSVCLQSAANPFCLTSGFTFDASGPDSAVPDSGADAADASDGGDAGPPPTVSLVTPNLGFATGGSSVVITGTGFVTGAVASINGNNCTSTTFTNSTSVTCAGTPAAVLTGTGATNEAVKVTNPGGPNGTGSGKIASFHYLSANVTPLALHWSTVGIHIATGISQIDDQIGLNNLAQATGGSQPPAPSGSFNGVASLPFSVFNGSSHSLAANPLSTSITSGLATVCTVGSMVVSTGVQVTSSLNAVSTTFIWAGTASNAWDFTTNSPGITFGSTDTSPHVWCYLANGTTTSQASVDNTVTTGNLTGTGTLVNFTLGALGNLGPRAWANFDWVGDMVWNGAVATSDQTNDRALLLAVSSP